MGRTLKRVPLDFNHPWQGRGNTWPGYLNPHHVVCSICDGSGQTADLEWLNSFASVLLLAGEPIGPRGLHPYLAGFSHRPKRPPTPAMGELTGGLAGRPPRSPFGHDACDRWSAVKAIVQAAGLHEDWGYCPACVGDGQDPAHKEAYEAWEPYEPPTGPGYQMWETTSEGSPASPVFGSLGALCEWLAPNASWFGDQHASKADWMRALGGDGVSGLMVMEVATGVMTVDGLPLAPSAFQSEDGGTP